MEGSTYRTEAVEAVCATDESMAVLHAHSLLEHCAVTIRVNLEFHSHGDVVISLDFLEGLICDDSLAISHENSRVLGCLN